MYAGPSFSGRFPHHPKKNAHGSSSNDKISKSKMTTLKKASILRSQSKNYTPTITLNLFSAQTHQFIKQKKKVNIKKSQQNPSSDSTGVSSEKNQI